ncbi:hypothetical protein ASG87_01660 [Frateuria sp. Soil773]|uniref:DUF416 family protein n=1 Tax=Frateuria sp. Soil773 TaxID=1736407 RepID=UPI0006FE9E79|nr:DUF416 family protein [Frateuria sp. Soil773]KRE90871.1 hypothetical protein ASG87_01660 [Frateuria sp. Soil773]
MAHSFDLNPLLADLKALDPTRQLAFGVCVLERALPAFFQFQSDTGCLGGGVLRAALAQAWAALEQGAAPPAFVSVAACETVLPDSEDHASPFASAAIDTVNIACCVLAFLEDQDVQQLVEAVEARRDTLDLFVQRTLDLDPADRNFEATIAAHPLMQKELGFLHDDLAFLQATKGPAVWRATLDHVRAAPWPRQLGG